MPRTRAGHKTSRLNTIKLSQNYSSIVKNLSSTILITTLSFLFKEHILFPLQIVNTGLNIKNNKSLIEILKTSGDTFWNCCFFYPLAYFLQNKKYFSTNNLLLHLIVGCGSSFRQFREIRNTPGMLEVA